MAKLSEVAVCVVRLGKVHGVQVESEMVKAYHLVLGRFPRMALVEAVHLALTEIKFMPKPAELYAAASKAMEHHFVPQHGEFDEATQWVMFKHGLNSSDDLSEKHVLEIHQEMSAGAAEWLQADPRKVPAEFVGAFPALEMV